MHFHKTVYYGYINDSKYSFMNRALVVNKRTKKICLLIYYDKTVKKNGKVQKHLDIHVLHVDLLI